jgi:hypothetical protein
MKTIPFVLRCLVLSAIVSPPAFAVYPPSTSLNEEQTRPLPTAGLDPAEVRRFSTVTDKLEDKERALNNVVQQLKKDEQDFKQSVQSLKTPPAAAPRADKSRAQPRSK